MLKDKAPSSFTDMKLRLTKIIIVSTYMAQTIPTDAHTNTLNYIQTKNMDENTNKAYRR